MKRITAVLATIALLVMALVPVSLAAAPDETAPETTAAEQTESAGDTQTPAAEPPASEAPAAEPPASEAPAETPAATDTTADSALTLMGQIGQTGFSQAPATDAITISDSATDIHFTLAARLYNDSGNDQLVDGATFTYECTDVQPPTNTNVVLMNRSGDVSDEENVVETSKGITPTNNKTAFAQVQLPAASELQFDENNQVQYTVTCTVSNTGDRTVAPATITYNVIVQKDAPATEEPTPTEPAASEEPTAEPTEAATVTPTEEPSEEPTAAPADPEPAAVIPEATPEPTIAPEAPSATPVPMAEPTATATPVPIAPEAPAAAQPVTTTAPVPTADPTPAPQLILKDQAPAEDSKSAADEVIDETNVNDLTTAADAEKWFEEQTGTHVIIVDRDGNEVDANAPLATGMEAVLVRNADGTVLDQANIIVPGDVMGTGRITLTQLVRVAKAMTDQKPLTGVYEDAADFNGDGAITLSDLVNEAKLYVDANM